MQIKLAFCSFFLVIFLVNSYANEDTECIIFQQFMRTASGIVRSQFTQKQKIRGIILSLQEQIDIQQIFNRHSCSDELVNTLSINQSEFSDQQTSFLVCKEKLNTFVTVVLQYQYSSQLVNQIEPIELFQVRLLKNLINQFQDAKNNCWPFLDLDNTFYDPAFKNTFEHNFSEQLCSEGFDFFLYFKKLSNAEYLSKLDVNKAQATHYNRFIERFAYCNIKLNLPTIPQFLIEEMLDQIIPEQIEEIFDRFESQYLNLKRLFHLQDFQGILDAMKQIYMNNLDIVLERNSIFDSLSCPRQVTQFFSILEQLLEKPRINFRIESSQILAYFKNISDDCGMNTQQVLTKEDLQLFIQRVDANQNLLLQPLIKEIQKSIQKRTHSVLFILWNELINQIHNWVELEKFKA